MAIMPTMASKMKTTITTHFSTLQFSSRFAEQREQAV
jgi:hypothetical protein